VVSCGRDNDESVLTRNPVLALTHVRVIDGTAGPVRADQTIVLRNGRITAIGPAAIVEIPPEAETLALPGRTVIPGLVGMHDHLFYQMERRGAWAPQRSLARLYLASGVTTIRTAGTFNFDGDVRAKRNIDEGREPGPRVHLTSPYLHTAKGAPNPERTAGQVARWADLGATSFKAYTSLRRAELAAAIRAAHRRGLKVTGHLCAVGFREAAALGIDNLEHGLMVDTEFYPKAPDTCPDLLTNADVLLKMDVGQKEIRETIAELVQRQVAITSTLTVIKSYTPSAMYDERMLPVLTPAMRGIFRQEHAAFTDPTWKVTSTWAALLDKEIEFERAFVAAGGLLMAGADPTGWGGVLPGFANQRQLELLVQGGFTTIEAIQIATANGARFLDEQDRIGTIAVGKYADLVVVRGDLSSNIHFIRNVELVLKHGIAFRPGVLLASVEETIGR
jgi:imidazolonepropionase-like amidohydrolase